MLDRGVPMDLEQTEKMLADVQTLLDQLLAEAAIWRPSAPTLDFLQRVAAAVGAPSPAELGKIRTVAVTFLFSARNVLETRIVQLRQGRSEVG
jgi:hypothetical protein